MVDRMSMAEGLSPTPTTDAPKASGAEKSLPMLANWQLSSKHSIAWPHHQPIIEQPLC